MENLPDDLYAALRKQAKLRQNSIGQEVISLLKAHVPTTRQLRRRRQLLQIALRLSFQSLAAELSAEEILRQDRLR